MVNIIQIKYLQLKLWANSPGFFQILNFRETNSKIGNQLKKIAQTNTEIGVLTAKVVEKKKSPKSIGS